MDRTAIEAISGLAVAQAQTNTLQGTDAVIVPEKYELKSLEQFRAVPFQFRGKFKTTILNEFTDYVINHGSESTAVYIDNLSFNASAIIDQGNHIEPQWGKHRATLQLTKTPEYKAFLESENYRFTQQDFIEFLEDWKPNILFVIDDVAQPASDFDKMIKVLRRVKVDAISTREQAVSNHAQSRSALESVEIKAGADQLPTAIIFTCQPYEDFLRVQFTCPIRSTSNDKGIVFAYRINQLEATKDLIAEEFRVKIAKTFYEKAPAIKIHIGTMDYQ